MLKKSNRLTFKHEGQRKREKSRKRGERKGTKVKFKTKILSERKIPHQRSASKRTVIRHFAHNNKLGGESACRGGGGDLKLEGSATAK